MGVQPIAPSLESTIHFLKRDPLYDTVKVFENRREDLKNVPRTNATLDRKNVVIENFRGKESSLDTNGFVCLNLDSGMTAEDFNETSQILEIYLPQLSEAVRKLLGAERVQIYDFTIRKRHATYPLIDSTAIVGDYRQPANAAHIDEVQQDVLRIMKKINPDEYETLSKQRWQSVIAWKPLGGPVRDWPLAVCDVRTVDTEADLHLCDILDPDRVSEEFMLHHNPEQKWYYLKDQTAEEVWVMHQADSKGRIGVAHSAFPNPESKDTDPLRESIDVTLLAFFKD